MCHATYGARAQTRTDHVKLVAKRLGWTTAEADGRVGWKALREFLVERALEHDVPSVLFRLATERLASDEVRMIRPGVVALMREIATARGDADGHLYRLVEPILTANPLLPGELDGLLVVPEEMSVSRMVWLHRGSTSYSPSGGVGKERVTKWRASHPPDKGGAIVTLALYLTAPAGPAAGASWLPHRSPVPRGHPGLGASRPGYSGAPVRGPAVQRGEIR